ncbi:hypothetical protein BT93_L1085 [Corymbia citriodora subsp. variegata]|uniref:Uncharacterized protein n=1 Tax=Corymbia citriodora subsp. variegata TaxID=360336 RepID=A0A8T0CTE2_CORYI|nr:hypothetical protein BT93_L1085 [Corymbia citriodora subsp. variegata]
MCYTVRDPQKGKGREKDIQNFFNKTSTCTCKTFVLHIFHCPRQYVLSKVEHRFCAKQKALLYFASAMRKQCSISVVKPSLPSSLCRFSRLSLHPLNSTSITELGNRKLNNH